MTIEQSVFVRIPHELNGQMIELISRAEAALVRSGKLSPGDRTETVRFDSLHAAIEQIAIAAISNGELFEVVPTTTNEELAGVSIFGPDWPRGKPEGEASRWVKEGHLVVELRLPHFVGPTPLGGTAGVGPNKPAKRWVSKAKTDKDNTQERFDYLVNQALSADGGFEGCIQPSGIANRVLTEGLRKHVHCQAGQRRIDVPVIYRDGSKGEPFPLRALPMTDQKPTGWMCYRFTLLSIRHVEMDHIVDGAWLRNIKISRTRAAGLTDAVVFETSRRQFRRLASVGPSLVYLYQTGLETAIIGFYRALTLQLLERPGSIAVVPCYYCKDGDFSEGTVWATN